MNITRDRAMDRAHRRLKLLQRRAPPLRESPFLSYSSTT